MAGKVYINGREAIFKGGSGKSIAFPDVCLCPPSPPTGPIPTPLMNTAQAADLQNGAATVTIEGKPVAHAMSFIARSTGNEVAQATGGGVITHMVQGAAYFQTYSRDVFIEGKPAVRHLDLLTHNHMARMPGNTPPAPWMSSMDPSSTPVAPQRVTVQRKEGKESITIVFLDEAGEPAEALDCTVVTPAGAKVEGRGGSTGTFVVTGLAKGKCQLTLPRHDSRCRKITRSLPKNLPSGAVLYRPGEPLMLATGKEHQVVVPWTIRLAINVCVGDAGSAMPKDTFTLKSSDGDYSHTVEIREKTGLHRWHVRMEFPALIPGATYSLLRQPASGGKSQKVFTDHAFETLMVPQKHHLRKRG